jgi:hypothetical protein
MYILYCIFVKNKKMERYLWRNLWKQSMVNLKNKNYKINQRAVDKTKSSSNGKYVTKIVDGVKYMVLK